MGEGTHEQKEIQNLVFDEGINSISHEVTDVSTLSV